MVWVLLVLVVAATSFFIGWRIREARISGECYRFINNLKVELKRDQVHRRWEFGDGGDFRVLVNGYPCFCPITYYCWRRTGAMYSIASHVAAGRAVGLSDDANERIVDAADKPGSLHKRLRWALQEALQIPDHTSD